MSGEWRNLGSRRWQVDHLSKSERRMAIAMFVVELLNLIANLLTALHIVGM